MGFFGKIKNILFEDDDEVEEMPVYSKDEIKESNKKNVENKNDSGEIEPIKPAEHYRFSNVKRDIDLNYDEKDVLGEIPGAKESIEEHKNKEENKEKEEKKSSIFMSFDEEEFERLNSRVIKNENRVRKEVSSVSTPISNNIARKANNNFSSTSTSRDTRIDNNDRYKINSGTLGNGKKPFTPSPVISPVYGILDKNYTKEDIIDRKDGLKRERVYKPIVHKKVEEVKVTEEKKEGTYEVDIDSVRKKAYGSLENLEKTLTKIEIPELKDNDDNKNTNDDSIDNNVDLETKNVEVIDPKDVEKISVEDQLDKDYEISNAIEEDLNSTDDLDEVVDKVIETKDIKTDAKKPKLMDELEKTSTLQILDDIEKELNSIKPISKNVETSDDSDEKESKVDDDTLESDLFNLIDSMYEEGEEDEDND